MDSDWFARITGFRECGYEATRARLAVEGEWLVSLVNGSRHGVGRFEVPTLAELRARSASSRQVGSPTRVRSEVGDARALHADPRFAGALFQVASQYNALEMVDPHLTPEDGVTRYALDRTQGPACAIAAGAGTIWRNYFLPLREPGSLAPAHWQAGQTATRQLDTSAELRTALAEATGLAPAALWVMRNGYAMARRTGLDAVGHLLAACSEEERDRLRGTLAVAVQHDVEVTDVPAAPRPTVCQVYASAMPVSYSGIDADAWGPLATLVLEAAYEATLLVACDRRRRTGCATVLLTRLGGGAFGNRDGWIDSAIQRALTRVEHEGLDVRLVSFGRVHPSFQAMVRAQ